MLKPSLKESVSCGGTSGIFTPATAAQGAGPGLHLPSLCPEGSAAIE